MKGSPFWKSIKLATKTNDKLPPKLRNLLKVSKFQHTGAGPRTLDSVISYLPNLKTDKTFNNRNSLFNLKNKEKIISQSNSNINIIICISQRDFPIGIHQRLLILLSMKGINLDNVQWVITHGDFLGFYPLFSKMPKSLTESNINIWRNQFHSELSTYLNYFINNKLKIKDDDYKKSASYNLFQTEINNNLESVEEKLKNYKIPLKNVHIFSNSYPWTITSLIESLNYDPYESTNTYILGQTNTGKTTLVKNMLELFKKEFEPLNNETLLQTDSISDPNEINISPTVFSSKFTTYTIPGMKIIDTPGYLRTEGGIYSLIKENLIYTLRIPKTPVLFEPKTLTLTPQTLNKDTPPFEANSRIDIGGLVSIKPWLVSFKTPKKDLPESERIPYYKEPNDIINVTIFRNMPGSVEAIVPMKANKMLINSNIIKGRYWHRYLLSGKRIELIIDNIGSFTAIVETLPEDVEIYWEIYLPQGIRFISRSWNTDGSVIFNHYTPFIKKATQILIGLRNEKLGIKTLKKKKSSSKKLSVNKT
ncbi:hypothetical protein C6P40_000394 [Pichia californica]|uniref:Genetic interactor of prohibitins 3, mitochondrial n=1 Tax=Pichia californica TaxID=460514 RepID=A0A9P7BG84_9ASCO|nr:hypothetical protein C6P40_000394 [[Candida] californica]